MAGEKEGRMRAEGEGLGLAGVSLVVFFWATHSFMISNVHWQDMCTACALC